MEGQTMGGRKATCTTEERCSHRQSESVLKDPGRVNKMENGSKDRGRMVNTKLAVEDIEDRVGGRLYRIAIAS
eukprot:scaffold8987_cov56-Attheya_sp.AAC.1